VAEEYFEYVDILTAAHAYTIDARASAASATPHRAFAFVELGAGYGHWTFAAHKALEQLLSGFDYQYLLVDVVSSILPAFQQLVALNGLDDQKLDFHVGYVSHSDTDTGENEAQKADAQHQVHQYSRGWGTGLTAADSDSMLRTNSLRTLFELYQMPDCVDMVDIDIQGGEYSEYEGRKGIFFGNESIALLTTRARRVHIGLHFSRGSEGRSERAKLVQKFQAHNWEVTHHEPTFKKNGNTTRGPVDFGDGLLSAVNRNGPPSCRSSGGQERHM
jgi:hypothetical protein